VYGDTHIECASSYYKYGCALFYKAGRGRHSPLLLKGAHTSFGALESPLQLNSNQRQLGCSSWFGCVGEASGGAGGCGCVFKRGWRLACLVRV
jgi:hypothetical protein